MNTHGLIEVLRTLQGHVNDISLHERYVQLTLHDCSPAKSRILLDLWDTATAVTMAVLNADQHAITLSVRACTDSQFIVCATASYRAATDPGHLPVIATFTDWDNPRDLVTTLTGVSTPDSGDVTAYGACRIDPDFTPRPGIHAVPQPGQRVA